MIFLLNTSSRLLSLIKDSKNSLVQNWLGGEDSLCLYSIKQSRMSSRLTSTSFVFPDSKCCSTSLGSSIVSFVSNDADSVVSVSKTTASISRFLQHSNPSSEKLVVAFSGEEMILDSVEGVAKGNVYESL